MKTAIDITDTLLAEARGLAARDRTTVRALVEHGLRRVVAERKRSHPFKLRDGSFGGSGLQLEFAGYSWDQIRDSIYQGRGG